jgi:hypothetical protein
MHMMQPWHATLAKKAQGARQRRFDLHPDVMRASTCVVVMMATCVHG